MADFDPAFRATLAREGGFRLHSIPGDTGGQTFAGIARRWHLKWPGWTLIDAGITDEAQLASFVREFYVAEFWTPIRGERIEHQGMAESIFDFAVNAGIKPAVKLAQHVVGATPDGVVGAETLQALAAASPGAFLRAYAIEKLRYYADIVNRNRSQSKFLLGWVNRTLSSVA